MKEIRKELFNACRLYKNEKYDEALEIFDKHYSNHPELFHIRFKTTYAWALFKGRISQSDDEEEMLESAEKITELAVQSDLNKTGYCVYTFAVRNIIRYLKNEGNFYDIPYWLDKLDPVLLDDKKSYYEGKPSQSNRESYYEISSITYFNCRDYERCIEISKKALESVSDFTNYGDIWHKWRIAKSLMEINRSYEALRYMEEVIDVKKEWYVYRAMAETYFRLGKSSKSLDYICPAVLSKGPSKAKVNLYYLIYRVLNSIKSEFALIHAKLYYLLKLESGAQIHPEIEKLDIDETQLNRRDLEKEITDLWIQYRFKNQKRQTGTVAKFIPEKNFGFIKTEDGDEIFFHKNEFEGDYIYTGQMVSFYTEESFDKSKNRKSVKAVIVRGE